MPTEHDKPLQILLLTDVFPPWSGGSGWSTFYLAKALASRGHQVRVLKPSYGVAPPHPVVQQHIYQGVAVEDLSVPDAPTWVRLGSARRAWSRRVAVKLLAQRASALSKQGRADVIHGQHLASSLAASRAATMARAKGLKTALVATIRDYWPLCPESTRLFCRPNGTCEECTDCHRLKPYLDMQRRNGTRGLASLPLALARWSATLASARALAKCDAVIAVSNYVRGELLRSRRVPSAKVVTIPNLVDLSSVDQALYANWPLRDLSPGDPFLLFVGKLEANKGVQMLPTLVEKSLVKLPVVVAGEGPLQSRVEREVATRGLDFRFTSWLDNDQVLMLMHSATALLFPSAWQEPLSRVLLEGCAAGAAIVALHTGGTGDILEHLKSGWLSTGTAGFSEGIAKVTSDNTLNARLRLGARNRAEERFSSENVSTQVEALYWELLDNLR